jgi:hypothetical protein
MVFRRGHQFPASPLAAAVPLDGSDTVPGLRQLERTVPAEAQRAAFHRSRRYGGPHLEQLTTDHLTAAPKPWKEFFEGASGWSGAYVVPASWFDLWDRAEENIVRFLVLPSTPRLPSRNTQLAPYGTVFHSFSMQH